MSSLRTFGGALALLALTVLWSTPVAVQADDHTLRPVTSFASIEDPAERSKALFEEMSRVLTHPRCINCHPAGDRPYQGDEPTLHNPPITRGPDGHGVVGMRCETCHHSSNFDPGQVPGAPHWHLAPLSMAWEGLTVGEICEQIKDPERNGGRSLADLQHHVTHDALVAWGWNPGPGREPAPGDQKTFAELVGAWIAAGAHCPTSDSGDSQHGGNAP